MRGRAFAPLATLLLAVIAIAGLVACDGSDGNGGATATPGQTTTPGQPTALPTAEIEGTRFESSVLPYAVEFPEGWTPDDNAIVRGEEIYDVFFSPEMAEEVQPNFSVSCRRLQEPLALELFANQHRQQLTEVGGGELVIEGQPAEVSGQPAFFITSTLDDPEVSLRKSEYILVTDTCAWTITMTVPKAAGEGYDRLFNSFVSSFTLVED